MANQSSTIQIQIAVNLKNLAQVGQLNAALKTLRKNIGDLGSGLSQANSGLSETAKNSKNAVGGVNNLAKALNKTFDAARQQAKEDSAATAALVSGVKKWNNMKVQDAKRAENAIRAEHNRTAAQIAKTDQVMAAQFKKIQTDELTAAQKKAAAQARIAASEQRMNERARAAARERARYEAEAQKTLSGRLKMYEQENDALFRAGFRIQMLGNDMMRMGQTGIKALAGIASEFGNFEFTANRAAGAMSLANDAVDGSTNLYQRFQGAILDAAQELKLFNPTDVAKATYYWASTTGQQINSLSDLKTLMAAINPLMKVAALTETDYETAIKGVYSVLVQYNKGLDDAGEVTAELFKTAQLTAAEFPDLINSFKMVGPVAAANNETFEDMVALFGRLADAGIRGSMSGRAFRQLFIQLVKPSDKAKNALDDLWKSTKQFGGESYIDMVFPQGKFVGVTKYVEMLATATGDLTQQQRNSLLATITTANELPVLTALVNRQIDAMHGVADATGDAKKQSQSAQEYFESAWTRLSDSWNGVVGAVQRGVETIRIQIGGRMAAMFEPIMKQFAAMLGSVREWINDPANGRVIDFFIRLVGFGSGILAVGGALTILGGAMITAAAATRVLSKAFGPLFSIIGKAGGLIGGVFAAIVRNFDYLRAAGETIVKNLTSAFKGASVSVDELSGAFGDLVDVTAPLFDFFVRTVADLAVLLSRLTKTVMENQGAMSLLSVAVQAAAIVMSAKMLGAVTGLIPGIGGLTARIAGLKDMYTLMSLRVERANGTLGKSKAVFRTLFSGVGSVATALGGIALGFSLAYENIPEFKRGVDSVISAFKDFRAEAKEAMESFDTFQNQVMGDISNNNIYKQLQKNVDDAKAAFDALGQSASSHDVLLADKKLKDAQNALDQYTISVKQNVDDIVATYRAAGADINTSDVLGKFYELQKGLQLDDISSTGGTLALRAYFEAFAKGGDTATEKIKNMTDAYNHFTLTSKSGVKISLAQWLNTTVGPETIKQVKADDLAKGIMAKYAGSLKDAAESGQSNVSASIKSAMLQELQSVKGVSPEMAQIINDMIGEAVMSGTEVTEEADAGAAKAYGEISSALLDNAKKFMDIDKQIGQIMKDAIRPSRQTQAVFKSYMSGWISKGFKDSDGHFHVEAQLFAQQSVTDLTTQFQTYFDQLNLAKPGSGVKLAKDTITQFKKDFPKGLPKSTPPEMRTAMEAFMTQVYQDAGYTEIPPAVLALIRGKAVNAGKEVPKGVGVGADTNTPEAAEARRKAQAMMTGVVHATDPGIAPRTNGESITGGLYTGMNKYKDDITGLTGDIGDSVKDLNFGRDPYTWWYHLGQNLYNGLGAWLKSIFGQIDSIGGHAQGVFAHSVPKSGPFKDDDQWFYHFGMNLASGLAESAPHIYRTAEDVAGGVADRLYGMSGNAALTGEFNASAQVNRKISVDVSVTSPDGSVNRMTTAQIEKSIMSDDLIVSLEHMAQVG